MSCDTLTVGSSSSSWSTALGRYPSRYLLTLCVGPDSGSDELSLSSLTSSNLFHGALSTMNATFS